MDVTELVDKTERVGYVAGALGAKRNTSLVDCQGWWWVVASLCVSMSALRANACLNTALARHDAKKPTASHLAWPEPPK